MILAAMYFALGLLSGGLIIIFALPMIWKRAERLTTRRIEAELPTTWSEIQAEKDRVRAEYAIATRRAEIARDQLRSKSLKQTLELNERNDELTSAQAEVSLLQETIADFELRLEQARDDVLTKGEKLARVSGDLKEVTRSRKTLDEEKKQKNEQLNIAQKDYDDRSQEIQVLSEELEALKTEHAQLQTDRSTDVIARASIESELDLAQEKNRQLEQELDGVNTKLGKLQSLIADRDEKIRRQKSNDNNKSHPDLEKDVSDLKSKLSNSEARRVEAEARLTALTLRSSNIISDDDAGLNAITELEKEKRTLLNQLEDAQKTEKSLEGVIANLKENKNASTNGKAKVQEDVLTKINDIAAHVVQIAVKKEGPGSSLETKIKKLKTPATKRSAKQTKVTLSDALASDK